MQPSRPGHRTALSHTFPFCLQKVYLCHSPWTTFSNLANEGTTTTAGTQHDHPCAALQRPQLSLFVLPDRNISTMAQTSGNCWTRTYTSPHQMCGAQLGLVQQQDLPHHSRQPGAYGVCSILCSLLWPLWTLLISCTF